MDDQEMNDELKEKERWNDPAAGFLTVSRNYCQHDTFILNTMTTIEKDA